MDKKLCKIDILDDNVYSHEYFIYSCENSEEIKKKIESFPTLYFNLKTNDVMFSFNYTNLFKVYENRLYFMIIFKNVEMSTSGHVWTFGDTFLKKYLTFFNSDSKTILFFKNQLKNNTDINDTNERKKQDSLISVLRTILEIFMALVIIVVLFLLYRKYRSTRKLHANELEDNNYEYKAKEDTENNDNKFSKLFISNDN